MLTAIISVFIGVLLLTSAQTRRNPATVIQRWSAHVQAALSWTWRDAWPAVRRQGWLYEFRLDEAFRKAREPRPRVIKRAAPKIAPEEATA